MYYIIPDWVINPFEEIVVQDSQNMQKELIELKTQLLDQSII